MNLGEFVNGKAQQPLPTTFIKHERELDEFQKYCHSLMLKILDLFAIGLEVCYQQSINNKTLLTIHRLMRSSVGGTGFHLAIVGLTPVDALCGSFITPQYPQEPTTNP
jgi:hypothetical protein